MARYRVGLETRERILDATRRLVSELGVEGVTLKAITDEATVGAGSFYNLFDSKEAAIFEVVHEAIEAVDPDPAGAGTDTLDELVDAFVAFITDAGPIARIYLQLALGRGLTDEAIGARTLRSHRRRVERFADAWQREDPSLSEAQARALAETLLAGLTGLGITSLLDPDFDMRAHARRLLEQVDH
ncbi:TetR/AcrR family transcriptional regulator [Egicoccus sp. AB-alg2]|uniref:TetR/AcrR family transcriptional regulator n=1 Tax=Egicoccus sp. AB-alg2 TaxID=3242693 RepID=UPI00359D6471